MNLINKILNDFDQELYNSIHKEEERLNNPIELIASENIVSNNILAVNGSVLTNKYADFVTSQAYKALRCSSGGIILFVFGAKTVCFKEAQTKEFIEY